MQPCCDDCHAKRSLNQHKLAVCRVELSINSRFERETYGNELLLIGSTRGRRLGWAG